LTENGQKPQPISRFDELERLEVMALGAIDPQGQN
jgi:hypothetical protein